jgi:hypothetical protein
MMESRRRCRCRCFPFTSCGIPINGMFHSRGRLQNCSASSCLSGHCPACHTISHRDYRSKTQSAPSPSLSPFSLLIFVSHLFSSSEFHSVWHWYGTLLPFSRPSCSYLIGLGVTMSTQVVTSPVLSWCCAPTYASPFSPPSLSVPTGPLYRLYWTNFGRCRDLDA